MRPRHDPPAALMALAAAQEHTLSLRQCLAHGLGMEVVGRLIHTHWRRIVPGVYATHHLPISWRARAWTGIHLGGQTARIGGWAAAHLHGFGPQPDQILVWRSKHPLVPRPGIFFRQDKLGRAAGREDLPVIGPADTVLDLAEGSPPDRIAALVADACNATPLTAAELLRAAEGRAHLSQRELLVECIETVASGAHSALERRYVRDVEQPHNLPPAQRQVWTGRDSRVDAMLAEYALVIELDGRKGHVGTGAFRDMARDNRHAARGLTTLRYGWDDVAGSPCETAHQIATVLFARGWEGPLTRCPRCDRVPFGRAA